MQNLITEGETEKNDVCSTVYNVYNVYNTLYAY